MHQIMIIGAGQLGSRHLQALANVRLPFSITVVDPSEESLRVAKERYESISQTGTQHAIRFSQTIEPQPEGVDIAIIPTNSDVRRSVVEKLLSTSRVRYLVLEKLLFGKREDYDAIQSLLDKHHVTAWVNCSMRTMPFYADLKSRLNSSTIQYDVFASQMGLATISIHFIDHIAYLTGGKIYTVDTSHLDPISIPSKRRGFLEFNGTLQVTFENGSIGTFTCYEDGDAPMQVNISNKMFRCISREWEKKAWVAESKTGWIWKEEEADIPYQSSMTATVVEDILQTETCALVPYTESAALHIPLLEALQDFLRSHSSETFDHYPFT